MDADAPYRKEVYLKVIMSMFEAINLIKESMEKQVEYIKILEDEVEELEAKVEDLKNG